MGIRKEIRVECDGQCNDTYDWAFLTVAEAREQLKSEGWWFGYGYFATSPTGLIALCPTCKPKKEK